MENVLIDSKNVGKVVHNGSGMCVKVKDMILNSLKDEKKVVIIDPECEYKEIANALGNKIEYYK